MMFGSETWDHPIAQFCEPCPHCGGRLVWGQLINWPVHLGGEPIGDYARCDGSCRKRWENYYNTFETPLDYPDGCFDEDGLLIGWALDGYFISGCEGPVWEYPENQGQSVG